MSKTQSDTGREGGLDVNKKVETKRGWQDTRADRGGAGRDRGKGSHGRTHTSPIWSKTEHFTSALELPIK